MKSKLCLLCALCVSGGDGLFAKLCLTLVIPWTVPARVLCPWDYPGRNTRVGCHFLLQGIFPTQELNLCLLPCRQMIYQLSYKGSPMCVSKDVYNFSFASQRSL